MTVSSVDLPERMTTTEVCALARFSAITLWRRRKQGKMPRAIDRGREALFDRDAVLRALGMHLPEKQCAPEADDPWAVNRDAINAIKARPVRHSSAT